MKQLLAILFLCNLLMLHYGRQAAYLQCRFINAVESRHCDCEKILNDKDHSVREHNSLPASVIKMSMPDEVFLQVCHHIPSYFTKRNVKPVSITDSFSEQMYIDIALKPPQA